MGGATGVGFSIYFEGRENRIVSWIAYESERLKLENISTRKSKGDKRNK